MGRQIKTTCLKCNETVTLDFGDANYSQALKMAEKLDRRAMECPGFHVEIGGWNKYWQLNRIIEEAYTEEEKDICRDIVRRITIQILDGKYLEKEHEFGTEKETGLFLQGLIDGGLKEDSRVHVRHYNYFKEELGDYEAPAKTALTYLSGSHLC
ncbi:hypothetical protein PUW25_25650 (plasmid) [Paenibacillus urinalis]|uniref:Uncharacterized protein n=1 Tax=Paenibacillus urinalis TaxID=521520 RepID=A0ABY7XH79_9BACL|nr:hypothetical protein [Paenibacillus urinalis]WDI05197.1 hypothetical protein PUW25_25650 [Paenibacillus urinalis]